MFSTGTYSINLINYAQFHIVAPNGVVQHNPVLNVKSNSMNEDVDGCSHETWLVAEVEKPPLASRFLG